MDQLWPGNQKEPLLVILFNSETFWGCEAPPPTPEPVWILKQGPLIMKKYFYKNMINLKLWVERIAVSGS